MAKLRHPVAPQNVAVGETVVEHAPNVDLMPDAGAPANAPFWLMTRYTSWKFEDGEFIPRCNRFQLKKGLRNIIEMKNGRLNTDVGVAGVTRRGWIVLRNGDPRLGDDRDYLKRSQLRSGNYHYYSKWQVPRIVGDSTYWGTDVEEQNAAYLRWVEAGVIPDLTAPVAEGMLLTAENRVSTLESLLMTQPGHGMLQIRYESASSRLAQMQAAYDAKFGEPIPNKRSAKSKAKSKVQSEDANLDDLLGGHDG